MKVLLIPLLALALTVPTILATEADAQPLTLNDCKRGCVRGADGAFNNAWRGFMAVCVYTGSRVPVVGSRAARRYCLRGARSAGAWAFRDHYDRCMRTWCD